MRHIAHIILVVTAMLPGTGLGKPRVCTESLMVAISAKEVSSAQMLAALREVLAPLSTSEEPWGRSGAVFMLKNPSSAITALQVSVSPTALTVGFRSKCLSDRAYEKSGNEQFMEDLFNSLKVSEPLKGWNVQLVDLWKPNPSAPANAAVPGYLPHPGPESLAKTEYFQTTGAGFTSWKDQPECLYGLVVELLKPLPVGATLTAEFENPADAAAPFLVPIEYQATTRLTPTSPRFACVTGGGAYKVVLRARSASGEELTSHTQVIRLSTMKPGFLKTPQ